MKLSIEITPNELVELIEMFDDDCDCDCEDCDHDDCEYCDGEDNLVNLLANAIAEIIEELGDE